MSRKNESRNGITEGVIWKQLLIFFFPLLFGTFFQQLYNTTDAIVVGQFVGKEALSAVGGTTGTLINVFVGLFVGISTGATVTISQYYGGRYEKEVSKAVHTAIALAIAGGIVIMFLGLLGAPTALRLMGTPEDIMPYSLIYIRIYRFSSLFIIAFIRRENFTGSTDNSRIRRFHENGITLEDGSLHHLNKY